MPKIVEEKTEDLLKLFADCIAEFFPKLGFMLLVFEFNKVAEANYISNGNRQDMIETLREMAQILENKQDQKTKPEDPVE